MTIDLSKRGNAESALKRLVNETIDMCALRNYVFLEEGLKKIREALSNGQIPSDSMIKELTTAFVNDFLGIEYFEKHGFEESSYVRDSFESYALDSIAMFTEILFLKNLNASKRLHMDYLQLTNEYAEDQFSRINENTMQSIKDIADIINDEGNLEKAARNTIPLFQNVYEGVYKSNKEIFKNMIKRHAPDLSKERQEIMLEGIMSIYTIYRKDNENGKLESDYKFVRDSLTHSSYNIRDNVLHILVKKDRKIINEIEIPCDDFVKWPFYLGKKMDGFHLHMQLMNISICQKWMKK